MMFGPRIAVEFVPEGVTAEEARRERRRRGPGRADFVRAGGALLFLAALVVVPAWWFLGRSGEAKAAERAPEPVTLVSSLPAASAPTATAAAAPSPTATVQAVQAFSPVFQSPVGVPSAAPLPGKREKLLAAQPRPPAKAAPGAAKLKPAIPTATPLPPPPAYAVIYRNVVTQTEGSSFHLSGWIVERDGVTPRPVAVELVYPTGSLKFPRPGMKETATGYYEFLAQPGDYLLRVLDDSATIAVPVHIPEGGPPARYEISLQYNGSRAVAPARSTPWDNRAAPAASANGRPTATPTPVPSRPRRFVIYMPAIAKNAPATRQNYLPFIAK